MRVPGLGELGVLELGERTVRKFFEHRMTTYAAALAYRALFALFPFMILVVALLGVLDLDAAFDRLARQADFGIPRRASGPLEPAIERSREQVRSLETLVEQARERVGGACSLSERQSPCGRATRPQGRSPKPWTPPTRSQRHAPDGNASRSGLCWGRPSRSC